MKVQYGLTQVIRIHEVQAIAAPHLQKKKKKNLVVSPASPMNRPRYIQTEQFARMNIYR